MDRIVETVGKKNNCQPSPPPPLPSACQYCFFVGLRTEPTADCGGGGHPLRSLLAGTFCGVFRRQALDRGAAQLGVDHIVTGHNADDIAETVLMNSTLFPIFLCLLQRLAFSLLSGLCFALPGEMTLSKLCSFFAPVMRGDIARLSRCTDIVTKGEDTIKRSKPFKYAYEKEIVMFVS
jgi:tRNA(Ile)-lysidine synthase TilS/MesJ